MEDRVYTSLSRHGLASSNSLLDGVPFKISQSFMAPSKVAAPPEFSRSDISNVLSAEYTFATEEGVLAWAQAREEALIQAAKEQAERLAQKQKLEETAGSRSENGNDNKSDVNPVIGGSNQNDVSDYDVPRNTASSQQNHLKHQEKPNVPPKPSEVRKPMSESSTILKPTPIHSSTNSVIVRKVEPNIENKVAENSSTFDVSMFESEADPFDNLELQTINDMEELKILLDSSSKSPVDNVLAQSNSSHPQTSLTNNAASVAPQLEAPISDTVYDMAGVVKKNKNMWETFSDDTTESGASTETESEIADVRGKTPSPTSGYSDNSSLAREDDEYVEITTSYKTQASNFHNHTINGVSKATVLENLADKNNPSSVLGGKLPASLINSKLYKPLLPPFNKPSGISGDGNHPNTNPFLLQTTQDTKSSILQNTPGHWISVGPNCDNNDTGSSGEQSIPSQKSAPSPKPALLLPPPPASRPPRNRQTVQNARMWSSVGPSLAASLDEPDSVSCNIFKNPYSRHSLSSSDLHLSNSSSDLDETGLKSSVLQKSTPQLSSQPWNRHRPLPPIPAPVPESYKVNLLPASQPVGLTDPYHSLSHEAQTFTNRITSMGFLRAKVARSVVKFGQDEKEVIDHLIAVDMLVEKKYAPVLVESALHTFKNDVDKAEKFLKMVTQFEELGFESEKIQEALVTTDMDYDKVLDILTT